MSLLKGQKIHLVCIKALKTTFFPVAYIANFFLSGVMLESLLRFSLPLDIASTEVHNNDSCAANSLRRRSNGMQRFGLADIWTAWLLRLDTQSRGVAHAAMARHQAKWFLQRLDWSLQNIRAARCTVCSQADKNNQKKLSVVPVRSSLVVTSTMSNRA